MKLDTYDISDVKPELIDFTDDVITIINYGKYQPQVVTAIPTWTGRAGEFVWVFGSTGGLYVCTTDNSTTWRVLATFTL